jgi:hypothetical protein
MRSCLVVFSIACLPLLVGCDRNEKSAPHRATDKGGQAKISDAPPEVDAGEATTITDLIETLELPADARPKDKSDSIRMDRANEWLSKNGTGKPVRLKCPGARTYNPSIVKIDSKKKLYEVTVYMNGSGSVHGLPIDTESITFQADEVTALWIQDQFKSVRNTLKTDVDFTVQGKIERLALGTFNDIRISVTLTGATVPESRK